MTGAQNTFCASGFKTEAKFLQIYLQAWEEHFGTQNIITVFQNFANNYVTQKLKTNFKKINFIVH